MAQRRGGCASGGHGRTGGRCGIDDDWRPRSAHGAGRGHPPEGYGTGTETARHCAGQGDRKDGSCHPAQPRRTEGTQPPHRSLYVPGPDRCRQDISRQETGGVYVRFVRRTHPYRHERIYGVVQRVATHRRTSGIRRLRGGRPVDGTRAPSPLLHRVARRD